MASTKLRSLIPMYHPFRYNSSYVKLSPYRRIFGQGVPILMYHKVGNPPRGTQKKKLYVEVPLLEKQLRQLRQAGFHSARLENWATFGKKPNNNQFVITFDDGSRSVFQLACRSLSEFGVSAIQYLVVDLIGGKNRWDTVKGEIEDALMNETEIREWLAAGHEIGAHTLTHPHLTRLTPQTAREEIFSSKKKLEDLFGIPIRHFCYPYGSWKPWVRDLVQEAGYETAVTTDANICTNIEDPFLLPRIPVAYPSRTCRTFFSQFLPWTV